MKFVSHLQLNSIQKTDQVLTCPFKPPTLLSMENISSEEFYCERAEAELLSREIQEDRNWYEEGRLDGQSAVRSHGGSRGAVWNVKQLGLSGQAHDDYIQGFNDVLDEFNEDFDAYMQELSKENL